MPGNKLAHYQFIEDVFEMLFRKETDDATILAALQEVNAGQALLLDVREQSEWNEIRFKGAKLIPTSHFRQLPLETDSMDDLDKNVKLYVHCAKGVRADKVANRLCTMGYDATPLKNSFEKLAEFGFETEC